MPDVRIVLNRKGVAEILRSPAVEADLRRRAEAVAARAGEGYVADSRIGRRRARASVRTADANVAAHERAHHVLIAALDAARR